MLITCSMASTNWPTHKSSSKFRQFYPHPVRMKETSWMIKLVIRVLSTITIPIWMLIQSISRKWPWASCHLILSTEANLTLNRWLTKVTKSQIQASTQTRSHPSSSWKSFLSSYHRSVTTTAPIRWEPKKERSHCMSSSRFFSSAAKLNTRKS